MNNYDATSEVPLLPKRCLRLSEEALAKIVYQLKKYDGYGKVNQIRKLFPKIPLGPIDF